MPLRSSPETFVDLPGVEEPRGIPWSVKHWSAHLVVSHFSYAKDTTREPARMASQLHTFMRTTTTIRNMLVLIIRLLILFDPNGN